jgi:hypothetical protein
LIQKQNVKGKNMTDQLAVTKDGKDISITGDLKVIYVKTLLSQDEYRVLESQLKMDFLTHYIGGQLIEKKVFAEDVFISASHIRENMLLEEIGYLQQDGKTWNENQNSLYSSELNPKYTLFYRFFANNPLGSLEEILVKLNISCKECEFNGSFFKIDEYTKNGIKIKLQKEGFRRMFSIDYMCCENEKLLFSISLTVNNLENKVKYWLRFHDSDKYYHVIFNFQASESRKNFIDQYPYLVFILDLINQ